MKRLWVCVVFAVIVSTSAFTDQKYEYMDYDGWWSKEAPAEKLGLGDDVQPDTDASNSDEYPFYDDIDKAKDVDENPDKSADVDENIDFKNGDVVSFEDLEKLLDEADADLREASKEINIFDKESEEHKAVEPEETDQEVQKEIERLRKEIEEPESVNNFDDYQVEDNRSDKDEEPLEVESDDNKDISSHEIPEEQASFFSDVMDLEFNQPEFDEPQEEESLDLNQVKADTKEKESSELEQVKADTKEKESSELDQVIADAKDKEPSDLDQVIAEAKEKESSDLNQVIADAKEILQTENQPYEEDLDAEAPQENKEDVSKDEVEDKSDNGDFFDDIIENQQNKEINSFLSETEIEHSQEKDKNEPETDELSNKDKNSEPTDNDSNDHKSKESRQAQPDDSVIKYENDMIDPVENVKQTKLEDEPEEDTVDEAYKDLHSDLEQLFATLKKFDEDSNSNEDNVAEYEEKYGKPFREDFVLSQRDDLYDNYGDLDDDTFKNLKDQLQDDNNSDESILLEVKSSTTNIDTAETHVVAESNISGEQTASISSISTTSTMPLTETKTAAQNQIEYTAPVTYKTISVEDLTREQYTELMSQFAKDHAEELDTNSEDFGRDIRAIHMTLTDDDSIEITSPNYPSPYPTNNVVDWLLEGEGRGIELNITDLAMRGPQADFLLIKPGGLDESGNEGLIFSYTLNERRLFRFTDVNKLFVRFQTGTGLSFQKGFHMTVKMIWPPEEDSDAEDIPIPEPLLPQPPATMSITLGGIMYPTFKDQQEEFRRLVADMATIYIRANSIDAGMNTTLETTQITNLATCNINWPNFENCVEVTFGVPLVYEDRNLTQLSEDHLRTMWDTYVDKDPFAARLRSMGVLEFAVPNESRVMLMWVVLAVGVMISAAMLAFSLWRYSCFESYTRMKTFGDTDSIGDEKRNLDLYPTPHQTLPPLYSESDMKWADAKYDDSSRVDIGGFTNVGYARDELLDIDSDEDVITSPRERYTTDV